MLQIGEIFNTAAIAAFITEEYSNRIPFLGEAFFPNKKVMGTDLKWLKSHKGLGVALKPSNYDTVPTLRPRGQASLTKEQMPIFRESMQIKETDIMELARIRNTDDPYLQPVLDSMYDDVKQLIDGAEISAEMLRMQLLAPANGNMQIAIGFADNTKYAYDYDSNGAWKASNYVGLSGTSTWNNPSTATPLTDIRNAITALAGKGVKAAVVLMNSVTFGYLLNSDQVKAALVTISGQPLNYVDDAIVTEVIRRKLGVEVLVYDKQYTDYANNAQKFYPDNYVTVIGDAQLGNTYRGTTPEEVTTIGFIDIPNAPVDIRVLDSGIAVAIQTEYKPSFAVTTTASQIVLPSFEGMDGIYVMKVA